jgi:expansin (peptidoglycan-binding protein)
MVRLSRFPSLVVLSALVWWGCTTVEAEPTHPENSSQIARGQQPTEPRPGAPASATPGTAGTTAPPSASTSRSLGAPTKGIATFYDADGTGNCSFPASPNDLLVVAPNKDRWYAGSAICGACMRVTGAKGAVVVRVVDSCPVGAEEGDCGDSGADLDLSEQAFAAIDDPDRGRVNVTFEIVECDVSGPMRYQFKSGSSPYWTAIQVQNHRLPIAKLEYAAGSGWVAMNREDDNFFVAQRGVGARPQGLALRITSSTGEVVQDNLPGILDGQTVNGTAQFSQ